MYILSIKNHLDNGFWYIKDYLFEDRLSMNRFLNGYIKMNQEAFDRNLSRVIYKGKAKLEYGRWVSGK